VDTLRTGIVLSIVVIAALFGAISVLAASAPTAPMWFYRGSTEGFNSENWAPQNTTAEAGNITVLTMEAITQTRTWQGYYGNITGWITLDDASNFTFYNWSAADPKGQLFASLKNDGTPTWYQIQCYTHADNSSAFQTFYKINQTDWDNVTLTYNETNHPPFEILNRTITGCPTTYIFRDDNYQSSEFVNFLLYDPTKVYAGTSETGTAGWIFGTMMENRSVGDHTDFSCYNGQICDFQLLVADDAHGTQSDPTEYYFWVDIVG
jgi:hypothetical protein